MHQPEIEVEKKWTIDKHIPLAGLVAFVMQTGFFIWWMAAFTTTTNLRLTAAEKKLDSMSNISERMAAVEARIAITNSTLEEIKYILIQRQGPELGAKNGER